jgi:hypothetical protein
MKLGKILSLSLLCLFLNFCLSLNSFSQSTGKTFIQGIVTDSISGDPVPFASVYLKGTTIGTLTDRSGKYHIETSTSEKLSESKIVFSFVGYNTALRNVSYHQSQTINIRLAVTPTRLKEVVVKPGKSKYSNDNPAVRLIEKVIDNKKTNRQESFDFLENKKYEKVQFALSNVTDDIVKNNSFRKFSFVFDNIDTTKAIAKRILPLYIMESLYSQYYRKDPESTKEITLAEKTIKFDEYLDTKGVSASLNYLYQNIDIYDDEILFLTNKFVSPVAKSAPAFYRYFITDTLQLSKVNCIKLFFEPRNKADFLFHGYLYITMDGTYAIRKIDMGLNDNINIDWVRNISISQDFKLAAPGTWLLSQDEISIDLGVTKNSLGLYGQRTLSFRDYKINEPIDNEIFRGPEKDVKIDPETNWDSVRYIPLTKSEKEVYSSMDSLSKVPDFKKKMNFVKLLTVGYMDLGNVELGPLGSLYSYNNFEGSRFRIGGRTTTKFNRRSTVDGFLAYGTKDKVLKYSLGVTYSLSPRTIYEFPVKALNFSFQKDIEIPGQDLQFIQDDNLFLSFKRGVNDKYTLNNTFRAQYLNEFENHFSFLLGYEYTRQIPEGNLYFNASNYGSSDTISFINISEPSISLRYAPNETFYQGKSFRIPYPGSDPVIQLKIAGGSKKIQNDFDYLRLQANISKRFYVSILGYTDISIEAGKIFGKVSYPLLFIHNANQTYSYQKNSYNLMNFLEFVSDQYVAVNADHCFNGFIFNKIPLLKKLKLREMATFKGLYGRVSDGNNPDYQSGLFKFPANAEGVPLTYSLKNQAYIEASVGVSNIFKVLRIDFIRRFTYTNNPNVSNFGVRMQFRLDI